MYLHFILLLSYFCIVQTYIVYLLNNCFFPHQVLAILSKTIMNSLVQCSSVTQSCLTLCDPWTVGHQASLSMEFSREEHWRGLPFSPLGDLLDLGTEPASPALAGRFFTIVPPGKPNLCRGRWQMPFASTNLLLTL